MDELCVCYHFSNSCCNNMAIHLPEGVLAMVGEVQIRGRAEGDQKRSDHEVLFLG